MPTAILRKTGQLTLPKPVRDLLQVQPGDRIDFTVDDRGEVRVCAQRFDVRDLRGSLSRFARKPVSLAAMDQAIRSAAGKRP